MRRALRTRFALPFFVLFFSTPARAQTSSTSWEAGAVTSYVTSGDFDGYGATVTGLWSPSAYFAFGATIDVSRLSASGIGGANQMQFRYAFLSAFAGAVAQLRMPVWRLVPYADLGLGIAIVGIARRENTQCDYGSGADGIVGAGLKFLVAPNIVVGARASARMPGGGIGCNDGVGPWTFEFDPLLAFGATIDLRW